MEKFRSFLHANNYSPLWPLPLPLSFKSLSTILFLAKKAKEEVSWWHYIAKGMPKNDMEKYKRAFNEGEEDNTGVDATAAAGPGAMSMPPLQQQLTKCDGTIRCFTDY